MHNVNEIERINKEKEGIIIAGTLGMKKRIEVIKKAKEKGITILNIKDADSYLKQTEEMLRKKKEDKQKSAKQEKSKEKEKEKKAKEIEKEEKAKEDKLAEKIEEDEIKKKEKEEKDKILTKKV